MRPTLTIIGCGNVGKALGRLWHVSGVASISQVLNRSLESAKEAVAFMDAGRPVASWSALVPADIYLVSVPDDHIEASARQLAATGILKPENIVFHCSGSLPSSIMQDVLACGAATASVHPIRSFASPDQVVGSFEGTWCGTEGTARAVAALQGLFAAIGARTVEIDASAKMLYHSAAVFASNYLVTLADLALEAYEQAGISRETGLLMIAPLMHKTVENVISMGPKKALSGPIARGDWGTIERQLRAIEAWNPERANLYKQLAERTKVLARRED